MKSYYLASGGPGGDSPAGQRGPQGPLGLWQTLRPPCERQGPRPSTRSAQAPQSLVANLKKTQSSLHVPLGEEAPGVLGTRARKSRSVGDLSHYAKHFNKCRRGGPLPMDRGPLTGALDGAQAQGAPGTAGCAAAPGASGAPGALRACLLLMLNAWRVRREEARALHGRVDQMRLQVTTLRALNKQEAERSCRAHQDAGRARAYGEALRQQLDALRTEHELVGAASAALEARVSEALTTVENLRNELRAAREEAAALDGQLSKERAKLAAAREERTQLREQVEEGARQLKDVETLLEAARLDCERASRSAEANGEELTRMSARCRALEEALEDEQRAAQQAQQVLADHSLELERTRALLALERTPRRSVCRLLEVLRVPLGLLQAFYLAVCPYSTSTATRSL